MSVIPLDLAHITDVHLGPLPPARLAELMSKRALGFLSWHRRRHRLHRIDVLDALALDLAADPPDHIAVTGDLVNIALPAEFEQATRWLEATGRPESLTLVPGNHDAYAGKSYHQGWSHWHPFMQGDEQDRPGTFPFVRRIGDKVALIGLSSAVTSPVGFASGKLGPAQLAALEVVLEKLGAEGLCRIILIHHPPLGPLIRRRRSLKDELALRGVIAAHGAELVLSGHQHVFMLGAIPGPRGPVPVIAGPSASMAPGHSRCSGYLRYRVEGEPSDLRITVQLRRFDQARGCLAVELTGRIVEDGLGLALAPADWPAEIVARRPAAAALATLD